MSTVRRAWVVGGVLLLVLGLNVFADEAYVTNRGGSSVTVIDTGTLTEVAGSPVTVGSGPVDIAADRPATSGPVQLYVANRGSNSVSVLRSNPLSVTSEITGDSVFGYFDVPSGITRMLTGAGAPMIAVVDRQVTAWPGLPSGRSTVRFIDPATNTVVDQLREYSITAQFNDVVFTSDPSTGNRRLWVSDEGDDGITVLKLNAAASTPPFYYSKTIDYASVVEFADFVTDQAASPVYLVNPVRLATNGTDRVVSVSSTNVVVTILDANYATAGGTSGEPGAVVATVTLPGVFPAGTGCNDVRIVGGFAYATTTAANGVAQNLFRIDLATQTVTGLAIVAGSATAGGLGVTSDNSTLLVGEGASAGTNLTRVNITPPATFAVLGATSFAGMAFPFGFHSAPPGTSAGGGGIPVWTTTSTGTSTSGAGCGLTGLEGLILLAALRMIRRRKA